MEGKGRGENRKGGEGWGKGGRGGSRKGEGKEEGEGRGRREGKNGLPLSEILNTPLSTIGPERRRATRNRRAAPRSHHADSTTAPLAVVHQRVTFKIAVLVFQCLTGNATAYLWQTTVG